MANSISSFLFDNDFAPGGRPDRIPYAEHEKLLAEARSEGFNSGLTQGRAEADGNLIATFARLSDALERLLRSQNKMQDAAKEIAINLSLSIAQRLVFNEQKTPLEALRQGIEDIFPDISPTPNLVVRVHTDLVVSAEKRFGEFLESRGYAGRLIILGDLDIALGDGQIEWADGGLVIEHDRIMKAAEEAVSVWLQHTSGRQG